MCISIFLMFTVLKMIMPVAAIHMKNELQPIMDRNDQYERVLHRIKRVLRPLDLSNAPPYDPHPPLDPPQEYKDRLEIKTEDDAEKESRINDLENTMDECRFNIFQILDDLTGEVDLADLQKKKKNIAWELDY